MSKSSDFDILDILAFYFRNFKFIAIISVVSVIVSSIVALLITPQFKSSVILFPASNTSISKELLTDVTRSNKDILQFGEDEEVEQLLQLLHSDEIKNRIIQKYDLYKHYGIDAQSAYPQTALAKMYAKNIKFSRTQYQSIEIEVYDEEAKLAANIATDIVELLDTVYNKIQKRRAFGALAIVQGEFKRLQNRAFELKDSLDLLRAIGLFDYNAQSIAYSAALAQSIEENNFTAQKNLRKNLMVLQRYGGAFLDLTSRMESTQKQLALISSKLAEARVDYEQNLSHKFIVNKASVAEKKAKPVRWLIVLVSSLSTFIFASVLLLLFEKINRMDWTQIKAQNK